MSDEVKKVVALTRRFDSREDITAAGFVPGWHGEPVEVGETAVVYGHGGWRQILVTKVTDQYVHGKFTTPSALDEARKGWEQALSRNPLAARTRTRELELRNWDFFAGELGPNALYPDVMNEFKRQQYQRAVDEGREAYADRKADEAAERVRAAAKAAEANGPTPNITAGKGDRTGKQGTNLYVRPRGFTSATVTQDARGVWGK